MAGQFHSDSDDPLTYLAVTAQQHPPGSLPRQLALTQLVKGLLQSGKLYRPYSPCNSNYEEIYREAQQNLFLYLCQNLERYQPERSSIITWVNMLMERRFFREASIQSRDAPLSLYDLDNISQPENSLSPSEILKKCLELDPDNFFKSEHIENYPEANFQQIALKRLSGKTWKTIAEELNLRIPTLSSFYQRSLKKFSAFLKDYYLDYDA